MRFVCGESSATSYTQKSQTYMIHRAESTSPGMVVLETNAYKEMRSRRFGGRVSNVFQGEPRGGEVEQRLNPQENLNSLYSLTGPLFFTLLVSENESAY